MNPVQELFNRCYFPCSLFSKALLTQEIEFVPQGLKLYYGAAGKIFYFDQIKNNDKTVP